MHRLTARFLLLFALVGSFLPLTLAASTAPQHACCRRKTAHPCHESASAESEQLAIRGINCCHQDSARAITTSRSANPQPPMVTKFAPIVTAQVNESHSQTPAAKVFSLQSTRAPPTLTIA